MERALQGDRNAFAELVESHRRVAASVAFGILGDVHLAADAVQEAFFKAYQGLSDLRDADRFLSWLLRIVRSTATDLRRRQVRWGSREIPMGNEAPEGVTASGAAERVKGPEEGLLRDERASHLRRALASLPQEYREVILLKHVEGRSYREIARLLKATVKAVESRLLRARQHLSRALREPGGDAELAGIAENSRPHDTAARGDGSREGPARDAEERVEGSTGRRKQARTAGPGAHAGEIRGRGVPREEPPSCEEDRE
ncbi:MAG: RNA polymerase sigma factor [Planctomycetota bacterium]